jgi:hypothetical protein
VADSGGNMGRTRAKENHEGTNVTERSSGADTVSSPPISTPALVNSLTSDDQASEESKRLVGEGQ